ncbi:polyketide synthase PksD [Whalleya microplaca]|nr:polyketide synthase PksD [Whalleya microplaca]
MVTKIKEAHSMDPQQRWLLEATYRGLENAGIPVERLAGTDTAVFSGSMSYDYMNIISKDPDRSPVNTATGTTASILANRLSWYFDLRGPSIQVDTACSSSMTAVDLACQSLRGEQTSMALVAGCNVLLTPERSLHLSSMNFLSEDGLSYSFDHRANGYARGEGVVVLVLKRLRDAVRDGDMIRAVIKASGSNQDGRTPGLTQPSQTSQEELIRKVYKSCNLSFAATRYIEAHGTGTQVGDTTEARVLGRIFRTSRRAAEPLYVGSIKPNIGHLEGASALASIVKCVMVLERGVIPPNALFEKWNPKIDNKFNRLEVPTSSVQWPSPGLRRISISSFGFGGSNSHIVLDDAYHSLESLGLRGNHRTQLVLRSPSPTEDVDTNGTMGETAEGAAVSTHPDLRQQIGRVDKLTEHRLCFGEDQVAWEETTSNSQQTSSHLILTATCTPSQSSGETSPLASLKHKLLIWSAKDEDTLRRILASQIKYYQEKVVGSADQLERLAYTLSARRSLMAWKVFAISGVNNSIQSTNLATSKILRSPRKNAVAFVFTGQGAQYAKMGVELLHYPIFHSTLVRVNDSLRRLGAEWSLFDELWLGDNINAPQISQPLCTALQIALVELLKSFGVTPDAVVGHSSGEIAAAYTIGALSLDSACRVAYQRGRLAAKLIASLDYASGMMSVNIPEEQVPAYLERVNAESQIHVSCVNSPFNTTLSGQELVLDKLKEVLDEDKVFCHKLKTGVAYHSPTMSQISQEYLCCLESLETRETSNSDIFMVSSVTGQHVSPYVVSSGEYWVNNLVSPVRFADALQYLSSAAPRVDGIKEISDYLEIGPHGALQRPTKDCLRQFLGSAGFRYVSALSKFDSPLKTILELVGHLFLHGFPVSVTAANQQDASQNPPFLTNLPGYKFDHQHLYWHESNCSRQWRLRDAPPRALLGVRTADWSPLAPRWRVTLSIGEMPWISDHIVNERVIFPATGTVMIALEAVREMVNTHKKLLAYTVKDATFMNPIVIPAESETELMVVLRPLQGVYEKSATRFEVQIFATIGDYWNNCFKAIIHIKYDEGPSEVDVGLEARTAVQDAIRNNENAKKESTIHVGKHDFYETLGRHGLKYGDSFSLVDNVHWNGSQVATARINFESLDLPLEAVAHPALLDAALQVCFVAPSEGMTKMLPTVVPHKIQDLWISATEWKCLRSPTVQVSTTSRLKSVDFGIESSLTILADDGSLLCQVNQLEMSPIMSTQSQGRDSSVVVHRIDWKPSLSVIEPVQLHSYCGLGNFPEDETAVISYCTQLEDTLRAVLQKKLPILQATDWSRVPPHMQKYVSWMKRQLQEESDRIEEPVEVSDETLAARLKGLEEARPSWRLFIEVAKNLVGLLRGETDPLELFYSTSVAGDLYDDFYRHIRNERLVSYLELQIHQTPGQRILEVGAGTGALTHSILSIMQQVEQHTGGIAFIEYAFTDVSGAFFEKASERFAEFHDRMAFKVFNIEKDIEAQGFHPGTYDLILAGDSLHVAADLAGALKRLRHLLKPEGHIIFRETTAPNPFVMGFGFGILPDWWRNDEDYREWGPTITEQEWDSVLRHSGFSGNDVVMRDYQNVSAHYASTIVSTAKGGTSSAIWVARTLLVIRDGDEHQHNLASVLAKELFASFEHHVQVLKLTQLSEASVGPADIVVFLADIGNSILDQTSEQTFGLVKGWMSQSTSVLWVAVANLYREPSVATYPHIGLQHGFLRTLRTELDRKSGIISFMVEDEVPDVTALAKSISAVFRSAFVDMSSEVEFVLRDGLIFTGRLVVDHDVSRQLSLSTNPYPTAEPWLPGPPLMLEVGTRGQLDSLRFTEDASHRNGLDDMSVEIEAKAWALNFRDVFAAVGRLEVDDGFGSDCAGIVTQVGSQCKSVKPGDRVCMFTFGCMRTYPRADAWCGLQASWPSKLRKDAAQKFLLQSATTPKKQLLIDEYSIASDHIFYSRDTSFAQGIKRMTHGHGVDVVLNSLVDEGLRASWECIAPFGRFIEIGKADINANASLPMACFAKNVMFAAMDLVHIFIDRKKHAQRILGKIWELVKDGAISSPRPLHVYGVNAAEDAFRNLQGGKNSGRIIIRIDPSTVVQKYLTAQTWTLEENSTYLVAGGFGGIGRSILRWMARKGAKYLLVLSRSGATSDSAATTVNELTEMGVKVMALKCDISVQESLSRALDDCNRSMPPIRGCVNATIALRDSIFENMTHAQWESAICAKAPTSWNLHTLLPDLDFFILLSSVSGIIGNAGQSNYAAGCTFQDYLARYRTSHGYKATAIDLGLMRTIGVVAENKELKQKVQVSPALTAIEEDEFLTLMDVCCSPTPIAADSSRSQLIIGLNTPMELLDRSLEPPEALKRPLFGYFGQPRGLSKAIKPTGDIDPALLFRHQESTEDRARIVVQSLARKLARALSVKAEDIDIDNPLHVFGVDSLVAVELRNWMARDFAANIPVYEIMGGRTVAAIGEHVAKVSQIHLARDGT